MDVKKKFTLNMTTLIIIVIILSVLVFLSATNSPGSQEPEPEQEPVNFDIETLFEDTEQEETVQETPAPPTETPAADSPGSQEEENVVATITFVDNQPPEKQLRQPDAVLTLPGDTTVSYTVRLHVSWSKRLHPNWYPRGAHISPMVAWSHRLKDAVFRSGDIASKGMEIMAETGATRTLVQEIQNITRTGAILSHNTGRVFNAPGEDAVQITMARNVPYITAVSMIAPSPDWFIAARNVELYKNGRWLERVSVPAALYDAGTDDGPEFTSADDDTDPQEPISRLKNPPAIPIATFEFVRN